MSSTTENWVGSKNLLQTIESLLPLLLTLLKYIWLFSCFIYGTKKHEGSVAGGAALAFPPHVGKRGPVGGHSTPSL